MTLTTHIVSHHVGGRGLTVAFFVPPRFRDDVLNVLYEADADACAAVAAEVATRPNFHLLPYALGAKRAKKPFFVMTNPYFSSLYRPNADYAQYYGEVELSGVISGIDLKDTRYDALYGSENRVARQIEVETHALDTLIAEGNIPAAATRPDLISLDTQGSELDILRGAERTIRSSTLAVLTEISLHRLYENQPLFSSSLDFLDTAGFHFAGFSELFEISPYRAPVGLRGRGFTGFGDAVFLRRLETLREVFTDPTALYFAARKLAFIALKHSFVEYALQALDLAERARKQAAPADVGRLAERQFDAFLTDFLAAAATLTRRLHDDRGALVETLRRQWHFYLQRTEDQVDIAFLARLRPEAPPLAAGPTQVEALLAANGFERLGQLLEARREAAFASLMPEESHPALRVVVDVSAQTGAARAADHTLMALASTSNLPAICARYDCEVSIIASTEVFRPLRQCPAAHVIRQYADLKLVGRDGARDYGAALWRAIRDLDQKMPATRLVLLSTDAVPADGLLDTMLRQIEATGVPAGVSAHGASVLAFKPTRTESTLGASNAIEALARLSSDARPTAVPTGRVAVAPPEARPHVPNFGSLGGATYHYRSHGCATVRVDLRADQPVRGDVSSIAEFNFMARHPDSCIEVESRLWCYAPEPARLVIFLYGDEKAEPIATSVTPLDARCLILARLVAEVSADGNPRPRRFVVAVAVEGDSDVYLNGTDAGPVDGLVSVTTVTDAVPVVVPISADEESARAVVAAETRAFRDANGREPFVLGPGEDFDCVILIAGQSMATNAGETPHVSRQAVANLNIFDGQIYRARDPLLGASEDRGSVASRLGDLLIDRGVAKRVLLVPIGIGGTHMREWVPGSALFQRIVLARHMLERRRVKPTCVLWVQGESDAGANVSRRDWIYGFRSMVAGMRELGIDAPILVARSTFCHEARPNSAAIREAQSDVVNPAIGVFAGPDTDELGVELRFDGCHFSAEGLARAAAMWVGCLESLPLPRLSAPALPQP